MKIALLLGLGLEGGGPSKHTEEFSAVYPADTYYLADKKWQRSHVHDLAAKPLYFKDKEKAAETLSAYDIVIIFTVPHASHGEEITNNFIYVLQNTKAKKVFLQITHTKHFLKTPRLDEYVKEMDLTVTYAKNYYYNWHKSITDKPCVSVDNGLVGIDFDRASKKYRVDASMQKEEIRWLGRGSSVKNGRLMIDFHDKFPETTTILEGLEAGIYWKTFTEGFNVENYFRPKKNPPYGLEEKNKCYLYPHFVNDEAMKRVARSMFGADLFRVKGCDYGNSMEFCHLEIVSAGAIPIFHEDLGKVVLNADKQPVVNDDSGTLWLSPSNYEKVAKQIRDLKGSLTLRKEYRRKSFEYWKKHSDSKVVYPKLMKAIEENI